MKKKKLTYVVSDIDKSLHFEWVSPELAKQFDLSYILIGVPDSALFKFLQKNQISVTLHPYQKKADLLKVWIAVFFQIRKIKPDIIHTHLLIANLVGLSAAYLARVPKRIYTRHHATIHHDEHPSGLKWDKFSNSLATDIIAISKNVEWILANMDKVSPGKITVIPHGFDLEYFQDINKQLIRDLYKKYQVPDYASPVIGIISRFTRFKGIQFIIPAFEKVLKVHPKAHLILANAHGDYEVQLDRLLQRLPSSSFTKIKFEKDLNTLYQLFTIFVHTPIDQRSEAFGQTYVEALIARIPSIFTLSGVAPEFIEHEKNALVVRFQNTDDIYDSIVRLINDSQLCGSLIANGKVAVKEYTLDRYLSRLILLYNR
jgi:glycosyltransferase involved in cell wall biosynthesis